MSVLAQKNPNIKIIVVDINQDRINGWNDENLNNLPIYKTGIMLIRELIFKKS